MSEKETTMKDMMTTMRSERVVRGQDLQHLTDVGYRAISMYQEDGIQIHTVARRCEGGGDGRSCHHGYSGLCHEFVEHKRAHPVTYSFFVIGRDEETVLGNLGHRVEVLDAQNESLQRQVDSAKYERDNMRKDLDASEKSVLKEKHNVKRAEDAAGKMLIQIERGEQALADEREKVEKLKAELTKRVTG